MWEVGRQQQLGSMWEVACGMYDVGVQSWEVVCGGTAGLEGMIQTLILNVYTVLISTIGHLS